MTPKVCATTNDISSLLKNVAFTVGTLREARRRYSAQLAPDFSMFSSLRNDEMGLSSVIADLLNPKGTHGHGGVFLDRFFKKLNQESEHSWLTSVCDWCVTTEKTISGKRRIDIYMKSERGLVAIENKPWAADQKDQLKDYGEYLKANKGNGNWLLIYLGKNSNPSAESIPNDTRVEWEDSKNLRLTDYYFLVEWLDECAALAKAMSVRIFIEEFAKFFRQEVNGEMDMHEQHEVINEILKSGENIAGALHVANVIKELKKGLLKKFKNDFEVACNKKNYIPEWDKDDAMDSRWPRYSGFGVRFDTTHRLYLRIQFEGVDLGSACWGIRVINKEVVYYDEVKWNNIKGIMSFEFNQVGGNQLWPCWSADLLKKIGDGFDDWSRSEMPWIEMDNGKLVERIVELADEVKHAFSKSGGLDLLK